MTREEALSWIAGIFEEPVENIKAETPREDIGAWDSIGVLNLIAAFDEKFSIQLSDEEVGQMKTINDVLNILEHRGILPAVA